MILLITSPLLVFILDRLSLVTPTIFPLLCCPLDGFTIVTLSLSFKLDPFITFYLGLEFSISSSSLTFFLVVTIYSSSPVCFLYKISKVFY